jgi:uncharacterized membrane protein
MSENKKVLAAIGYIPPLFFIPLFLAGDDGFAKFHGRQALVIFAVWILTVLVFGLVLHWLFVWLRPIQLVIDLLQGILYVIYTVFSIWGLVQAAKGNLWRVPILGAYSDRLNI